MVPRGIWKYRGPSQGTDWELVLLSALPEVANTQTRSPDVLGFSWRGGRVFDEGEGEQRPDEMAPSAVATRVFILVEAARSTTICAVAASFFTS